MEPVNLFDLAAKQSQWLAVRQSAIASNIANVNTPGYTAGDVEPFEKVLDRTAVSLNATQAGHLGTAATNAGFTVKPEETTGSIMPSKNTVVLENELMKAGEVPPLLRTQHRDRQGIPFHDDDGCEELTMDALTAALKVAASGLGAQSERLRVVSENLANAQSTGDTPGADPYRRKTISFVSQLDRSSGGSLVEVSSIDRDPAAFPVEFQPGNEAADDKGYVKMPNVNVLIEMADMSEANRSYEANLQVIKQARDLISMTIDLMRNQ